MSTCTLRRIYKDYIRPMGDPQPIHRPAFGSKYFTIQQWTGCRREWLQIHHARARRTAAQSGGQFLKTILRGLWAWATWAPGSPVCAMGCLEAAKVSFRWASRSGVFGYLGSLSEWVAGLEQEDMEGQVMGGGMIQIDPKNPPMPQMIREWLWESYPDRLAEKLREASKAHEELVDAAVLLMEGYSQVNRILNESQRNHLPVWCAEMYLEE